MNFLSVEFWILVVFTIVGCNIVTKKETKFVVLGITSLVFYAYWDVRFLCLLFIYSIFIYGSALIIEAGKKYFCVLTIIFSLILLGYFKYYNFFITTINDIFDNNFSILNIILPIGISFYILTSIGYIIDIYKGKYSAEKSFLKVFILICYYPKLISGPIERGNNFFIKLENIEKLTKERFYTGIQIILLGLIKKIVIADRLGVCVDAVFAHPSVYAAPSLICAMVSYTIQIYCDFSGYTDIAVGISYLIGIPLERNFNLPYCAQNPSDFWRRWHISLSGWFRDYVYIPLGGSRKGEIRTYINLLATMFISGLWHGANWTFVIWGAIHGFVQCLHALFVKIKKENVKLPNSKISKYIRMIGCNLFVTIAWTIFRVDNIEKAMTIFERVINWRTGQMYIYVFTPIYFFLVMFCCIYQYKVNNGNGYYLNLNLDEDRNYGVFIVFLMLLIALAYFGNGAFIYNNF